MGFGETTSEEIERVAREIVDAAFKIHSKLGPGLLESAYLALMVYELNKRGLHVDKEVPLPVVYEDVRLDIGYRIDIIVENCVIIELKLTGLRLGILINFNTKLIKDGIKRVVL